MSDIPLPDGFSAAGIACGIKSDPGTLDLALFASTRACTTAGVFTQNRVCGAPVHVSRSRVPRSSARAVVINSGNANACTGERGLQDAAWMTAEIASRLRCDAEDVLVCSTGVIGRFLPREKLAAGFPKVVESLGTTPQALESAARAMMTTDTVPKLATRSCEIAGRTVRITGVCKGAAMIAPNMATMLSVIMTDAALSQTDADTMLRHAVDRSFNCISVEGHTSTSDTVLLLANGVANGPLGEEDRERLQQMIDEVAQDLAQAIIRDAEGADHVITIDVQGLQTRADAMRIARTVADSPLVKTAITGADPNWGRIVSAVGYSGVNVDEQDISLALNGMPLYRAGTPLDFDAKTVSDSIRNNRDVHIELTITRGDASARFWTSDLTAEYVRLNSEYTT